MTHASVVAHGTVLAKSGEAVKSGPIGLAVILILCIACYFLFKSMSRHLRTVRDEFPREPVAPPVRATGPAVSITSVGMTADGPARSRPIEEPSDERISERAELLPEEIAAGSDDPKSQAEIILEDSDARTEQPEETKRDSTQTPD